MHDLGQEMRPDPVIVGYDVVRWLGRGAHGTVWLLAATHGGTLVAAKCFPAAPSPDVGDGAAGAGQDPTLDTEWRALAACQHPNLVTARAVVVDTAAAGGGVALLMDYAAGGSLRDLVAARGPLSVGEAVTVLTPLGQVLSYLHGVGVVHGDVAPGNILFTAAGKPLLGDLGAAQLRGQGPAHPAGTAGFVAGADPVAGAPGDVFAAAAVGWYALTGMAPAATRDRLPLSTHVPGVPVELAAALEAGLADDPAARPTASALAQAIFRSARAEPVVLAAAVHPSVLPELLTARPGRPHRHDRAWWARGVRGWQWHRLNRGRARRGGRADAGIPAREVARHAAAHRRRVSSQGWSVLAAGLCVVLAAGGAGTGWWLLHAPVSPGATRPPLVSVPASPAATVSGAAPALTLATSPATTPATLTVEAARAILGPAGTLVSAPLLPALFATDPAVALAGLAALRAEALGTGQPTMLLAVSAPGSPALRADTALVRALRDDGLRYQGLASTVGSVQVVARSATPAGAEDPTDSVLLTATITTSAFHTRGGAVGEQGPRSQVVRLLLVWVAHRWVVQEVLASHD